jgi:ketosteroid isomerase-like protein
LTLNMNDITTRRRAAEAWLGAFAKAVRDRDFESARRMCRDDVAGFGTVVARYEGIDELQHGQWRPVWDRTEGFEFDVDVATIWVDESLVVATSEWSSTGIDADGSRRPRHGRATIVLTGPDAELRAVHTHFSMLPGHVA